MRQKETIQMRNLLEGVLLQTESKNPHGADPQGAARLIEPDRV